MLFSTYIACWLKFMIKGFNSLFYSWLNDKFSCRSCAWGWLLDFKDGLVVR